MKLLSQSESYWRGELETARRLAATAPSTEAWVEARRRQRLAEDALAPPEKLNQGAAQWMRYKEFEEGYRS